MSDKKHGVNCDVHVDRREEDNWSYEDMKKLVAMMKDGTLSVDRVGKEFFPDENDPNSK